MKRKLFSLLLSAFALLLLMGAGIEQDHAAALLIEEVEAPTSGTSYTAVTAAAGVALSEAEIVADDDTLLVDGRPASLETMRTVVDGVTYVSLKAMALELDSTATVTWNGGTAGVTTAHLSLTAQQGQRYVVANERYLYVPKGVQVVNGNTMLPLNTVAKAFGAQVRWDGATGVTHVTRGSGAILPGSQFYNGDDLFWLSRVIYAESGNQPLEGKMGVGIVVLNRVADPAYPNTIKSVLAQKNQFTTYAGGRLADRTPNEGSVLAAKLVLDGGMVSGLENATHFDSARNSWASRNLACVATIGGHKFYA